VLKENKKIAKNINHLQKFVKIVRLVTLIMV